MTEREKIERELILDILIESSKWRISEDDDQNDGIRLEVMDRARRLFLGTETVDAKGHPDNPPAEDEVLNEDDYKELEAARLNEYLSNRSKSREKWKADKVRCLENGKVVWHPERECHQEKLFPNNPKAKKFRWVWDGPKDKQKQIDAMWKEHEQEVK